MSPRSLKTLSAFIFSALLANTGTAAETSAGGLHSGIFEGLMLAVGPDGAVQGRYREEQGEGVTKTCSFYLAGHVSDAPTIPIQTWQRDVYPGILAPTADGVELAIPSGREHPGCGLVLLPAISQGIDLSETRHAAWLALEQISASRALLRAKPEDEEKSHQYIIKGDIVGVLDRRPHWLHVEYVKADQGSATGWIHETEADLLQPPEPNKPK